MRPVRSLLRRGRRRPSRTFLGLVTTAFVALVVLFGPATVAHAGPTPAEVEQQIDQAWLKLEPFVEQHNKIRSQLADNQAKAAKLAAQIRPLQLQLDAAMSKISVISVEAYKGKRASALNAILAEGTAVNLVDQLTMLDAIAKVQTDQVADVLKLKAQYDKQKKPYDDLVAQLAVQEREVAAQRKSLDAEIANLNQLRLVAYGTNPGTGALRPVACPTAYDGSPSAKAAQVACAQIGKPYVFATAGPETFDCSGLTLYAWGTQGVRLRHYVNWQWDDTRHITRDQLVPGSLVYYYSDMHHMGMYVGSGWIVHASQPGEPVKMAHLDDFPISGYSQPG
jgi:cell wall-associated NlpC family hydrolase